MSGWDTVNQINYGLNHLNGFLGGVNNYLDVKNYGGTTGQAVASGAMTWGLNAGRVEMAEGMRQDYGTYSGHLVNNMFGWSSPMSSFGAYPGLLMTGMAHHMAGSGFGCGMPFMFGMGFGMCGPSMFGNRFYGC